MVDVNEIIDKIKSGRLVQTFKANREHEKQVKEKVSERKGNMALLLLRQCNGFERN